MDDQSLEMHSEMVHINFTSLFCLLTTQLRIVVLRLIRPMVMLILLVELCLVLERYIPVMLGIFCQEHLSGIAHPMDYGLELRQLVIVRV